MEEYCKLPCYGLRFPRLRQIFFFWTPHGNLPFRSMKKTTLCKRETEGAYHLAKKSGNFGLKSNGKVIFRKLWSTFKGTPLFPFGTERRKFPYHLVNFPVPVSHQPKTITRSRITNGKCYLARLVCWFWKNPYHYSTVIPTGLFWQMVSTQNYPARSPRWLAIKIFFWLISETDFVISGTCLVIKSAQELFSPRNKLSRQNCRSPENMASSRPVARGSPRMANCHVNKRIINWLPFWNKWCFLICLNTRVAEFSSSALYFFKKIFSNYWMR